MRAILLLSLVAAMACGAPEPPVPTPTELRASIDRGRHDRAIEGAHRLLQTIDAEEKADEGQRAVALDLLVEALWRAGRAREAETIELAERAVRIREASAGRDSPALVPGLTNLGTVYRRNGDERTEPTLERARTIAIESGGEHDALVAPVWTQLGIVRLTQGRMDEARGFLERAIANFESVDGAESVRLADPLRALGILEHYAGHYDESAAIYRRLLALERRHLAQDSPDRARTLTGYGALLQETGDVAGARSQFEKALEIRRRILEPDHPDVAASLNNLAIVLEDIGDYANADRYYAEALELFESRLGPDHPYVADALNNRGNALRELGEYDRARRAFERALAIRERTLEGDHVDLAQSLTNLAILLTETGEYTEAMALYDRALPIWKTALGAQHMEVAECLNSRANLRVRLGQADRAAAEFREALAIREQVGGEDHPLVAETLEDAARAAVERGDPAEALELALAAHGIRRAHVRTTSRILTEREALTYARSRTPALDLALELADGAPGEVERVWDAVVRSRALVLDEMAERARRATDEDDPRVAELVGRLREARAELAELWVDGGFSFAPEEYRELLTEAHRTKQAAERELARVSASYRNRLEQENAGLDAVREELGPDTALVAYTRYANRDGATVYIAFVLRGGAREAETVRIGPAEELDSLIEAWRGALMRGGVARSRALRRAENDYRVVAARLRDRIWTPLVPMLGGAGRVYLVVDGALNLVSFAALPVGDDGYMIGRPPEIRHLVTERDLLRIDAPRPVRGRGMLALGGPDFDDRLETAPMADVSTTRSLSCEAFRNLEFSPLPQSEREAREVAAMWQAAGVGGGPVALLTRSDATERGFKTRVAGRRVVHVATHGYFLGDSCLPGATAGEREVLRQNPLLLSGLAMAGANRREELGGGGEDGILTAEEISALDLRAAEWAVLSACETALGTIRPGEDVFGLRRAFQIAGASRVVMSLWAVDDAATRDWMTAFYGAVLDGRTMPDRRAGRAVLEQRRRSGASTHPYFWAAFVAYGV